MNPGGEKSNEKPGILDLITDEGLDELTNKRQCVKQKTVMHAEIDGVTFIDEVRSIFKEADKPRLLEDGEHRRINVRSTQLDPIV